MLSGVNVICFAASYAVALALELTRPWFRSGLRGALMVGFAAAGLVAHSIFLAYRIVAYYESPPASGSPLSIAQDWYLAAAWVLVVVYLLLTCFRPKMHFGVFLLPLVLALIGVGVWLADPQPFARGPASKVWGVVHGGSILLATVAVLVGLVSGLMYLAQDYRLRHKGATRPALRFPSLEWLRQTNSRAVSTAIGMLAVGIVSGVVLNMIRTEPGGRLPWYDPVVLTTVLMFGWLVVSRGLGLVYRPAREGLKVAYLTLASFVFLVVVLAVVLWGNTQHGGGP